MLYGQLTTLWKYTKSVFKFTRMVASYDGWWEDGGAMGWPQAQTFRCLPALPPQATGAASPSGVLAMKLQENQSHEDKQGG